MGRTFTAQDLIQLPRLNGRETVVLMTELETEAAAHDPSGKSLPAPIERSRKRLGVALTGLDEVTRPKADDEADTQAKRKADQVIDKGWSATFDWLSGWCKLPLEKNPNLPRATALFNLVFGDALAFTKLPYKIEWKESKSRLDAIESEGHAKTFKALGGAIFLSHLTESHAAYGKALHITVPRVEEGPAPEVRVKFDAALAAIRDYAARVSAHADPDVPGSADLAEVLLRPLTMWESSHTVASEPSSETTEGGEGAATDDEPTDS